MTEREREREKLIELLEEADQVAQAKGITDYKDAIADNADHLLANGVIVPLVTIGQTVWYLRGRYDESFEIAEGKVSMLQQKADKSWKVRITVNSSVWDFTPNDIGTRYFLTKEEALKALKERSEGK